MISYEGKNCRTVNYLKSIYFDHPEWTPCGVRIMTATWMKYQDELEDIVLRHPRIFPDFRKGNVDFASFDAIPPVREVVRTDTWGTLWKNITPGLDSIAVGYPLANWDAFDTWIPPDPLTQHEWGPRDWDAVKWEMERERAAGDLVHGSGLMHGFLYMRLYYLRGFENLMLDIATTDPRLDRLIDIIACYNIVVVNKYLELGAEFMCFGDDLGNQTALPISPAAWRRYIKPTYERMFRPCRERDLPVYLHSDGRIIEIIDDLIDAGVTIINPQVGANGLENLKRWVGRVSITIDLDRQLFPFATEAEIEDHIAEAHAALYLPEGGLDMWAECDPDVPLENIETICGTLEQVCNVPEPDTTGENQSPAIECT